MILLLIFCCISATVFADDDHFRSSYFINAENRRLAAQMPKRVYFDSVLSCSHACLKNPWCFSSNFKFGAGGEGVCELIKYHSNSADNNNKIIHQPGNTFTVIPKVSKCSILLAQYCTRNSLKIEHFSVGVSH